MTPHIMKGMIYGLINLDMANQQPWKFQSGGSGKKLRCCLRSLRFGGPTLANCQ